MSSGLVCVSPPNGMLNVKRLYGINETTEMSKGACRGDPRWESENLIVLRNVCNTRLNIQLHHKIAPLFLDCMERAVAACPKYPIAQLGGYCARHQRNDPTLPLSIHSYGGAFDINWDKNPMGKKLVTDLPAKFVSSFTDAGWEWGGNWKSIADPMHFQYATGV